MKYRFGVVPFVNMAPMVYLLEDEPEVELVPAPPAVLVDMLRRKEIDAGTLPVRALIENEDFKLVPGYGVCSLGPVRSVKLFLRKPAREVESVGLDSGSRSSAGLVRIFFEKRLGIKPIYREIDPAGGPGSKRMDATLLIGDAALRAEWDGEAVDMGEFWTNHTGLPFVYAGWVCSGDADIDRIGDIVRRAAERGLDNITGIADMAAERSGLSRDLVGEYLTANIHYSIGAEEMAGLQAYEKGLIGLFNKA